MRTISLVFAPDRLASVERIALEIGGVRREYLLSRVEPNAARRTPLVLFLHGTGAIADWADDETGWSRLAERERFAVAIPQALTPNPAQPPRFLTNPPHWNDGSTAIDHRPDDVEFLAAVMDDAAARSGANPAQVLVTGFSNGAGMAFRLAAELAERVAAVAPVAGHCWLPHPQPARPVPTLYLVGAVDPLIPLRGGDVRSPWQHRYVRRPPVAATLEKWATAIGCAPVPQMESDAAGVRTSVYPGPVLFRSLVIDGLGHHWPGGKGGFNPRIAGTPVDKVNGTELVWEFFKQQIG
jgi:polyhydroxybutyrate depolymerase